MMQGLRLQGVPIGLM